LILSQTTEYALRAMLFIAAKHPMPVRASELAAALGLPRNYLGKTLGRLVQARVLSSARGTTGGFRLGRDAAAITLHDVLQPFSPNEPRRCLLGIGACGHNPHCAVHHHWLPAATVIDRFFTSTTIADLVAAPDRLPAADIAPPSTALLSF
jgi:Rrf2 family protein